MKQHLLLLIVLALLSLSSCHHRKSAEEGKLFLLTIDSLVSYAVNTDSIHYFRQQLIKAEYNYRFTPEQLVQLRTRQIYYCSPDDEASSQFIAEAEAEALRLNNDSMLALLRRQAFLYYTKKNDTTNAIRLFRSQEPLLTAQGATKELNIYHAALAFLYTRLNQPEEAIHHHLQTRRMNERRLALWYSNMSQYLLNAGRGNEALLYADSSLHLPQKAFKTVPIAYLVKARILANHGRIPEALAFYATTLHEIESERKKRNGAAANLYNINEDLLIYQYAKLLHQNGHTHEAIPLLEKIEPYSQHFERLQNKNETIAYTGLASDHLIPQHLLAECYHSLGQTEKALHYTHIADSLQRNYGGELQQTRFLERQTKHSNQYLTADLRAKEQEARTARLMQYILWSAVVLLLAVIAGGLLWWRNHRRRLRQLFNELVRRHAEWMQIRALLIEASGEEVFSDKHSPAMLTIHIDDTATIDNTAVLSDAAVQTHRRHYLSALRVMKEQCPFTDPEFDLVALARLVGTNRTQLSTAINQQAGTSFSNWLAEYRINYLISQIDLYTDNTIDQLYPNAGFAVRSTFYRQFRQVTGLTPKQYLKEKGEK